MFSSEELNGTNLQNAREKFYELITGDINNEQKLGLRNKIDEIFKVPPNISSLKQYSNDILSSNKIYVYYGLNRIRRLLTTPDISLSSIIQSVLDLPCINEICLIALNSEINLLVFEAIWIIASIGSGNYNQCNEIINRKGIEIIMKALKSQFGLIVEQAVWCVGNFTTEVNFRNMFLQQNIIEQLLWHAEKQRFRNQDIYKTVVWSMSNIVRTQPCLTDTKNNKLTEFFSDVIKESDNQEILLYSLQALTVISREAYQIESILEMNIIPKLVKLLQQSYIDIVIPTIQVISNLLSGDGEQTEMILQFNIIDIFQTLLQNQQKRIIKEVCFGISNIAAGTTSQVKQILRNDSLIQNLLSLINEQNMYFNREINWIFSNLICYGAQEDIDYAIDLGIIQGIKKLLTQSLNEEQLKISLQGIQELFRKIQFSKNPIMKDQALKEIIEQLYFHKDRDIQNYALKLLENYFDFQENID